MVAERRGGHAECGHRGLNSYRADYNIGVIYELPRERKRRLPITGIAAAMRQQRERIREAGAKVEEKL